MIARKIHINESQELRLLIEAATVQEIYDKYYRGLINREDFMTIIETDPTFNREKPDKMGKYAKWIISMWQNLRVYPHELPDLGYYLSVFDKFKQRLPNKDINNYRSLPELYTAIEPFLENPGQATSKADEIRKIKQGAEKVYEDDEWLVVVPHTRDAAIYYGKGTRWCTAAVKSRNLFDEYNKTGELFINIRKNLIPGRSSKYQFQFQEEQYKDDENEDIRTPIAKEMGMTRGLYEFYVRRFGATAVVALTENYWEYEYVMNTDGYYVDDWHRTLYRYDVETGQFLEIASVEDLYDDRSVFQPKGTINGRYIPVEMNGEPAMVYDLKANQFVDAPTV